ncbi:hypothetical protein AYO44_12505 [Planctomycetaceae bacterium SCGC AG-212-F19]|nr:hypothetical protein AYO44_12505 [Planctomycetaceae bacterium SCGC AG-212-F19]
MRNQSQRRFRRQNSRLLDQELPISEWLVRTTVCAAVGTRQASASREQVIAWLVDGCLSSLAPAARELYPLRTGPIGFDDPGQEEAGHVSRYLG